MNNCDMYQELISRLVDGELSREEYAALEEHMNSCPQCSAMYAVFASLSDIIGGEDEPLPEDLHENIMAGVRRSAMIDHNRRRLSKPMRNTLAAAACAALVLFAARGLSPAEKAAQGVLTESEAAVMDVADADAWDNAAPAATPGPAAQQSPVPSAAAEASPRPAVTPRPTASPVPTADVYLSSDEDEAKPQNTPQNNNTNNNSSVLVTPRPTEIVVHTPSAVSTPVPSEQPVNTVTVTASPRPTEPVAAQASEEPAAAPAALDGDSVSSQPTPGTAAGTDAAEESGASAPAAQAAESSESPVPAAEPAKAAASDAPAPVETEPVQTQAPSLSRRIFSLFTFAMPAAMSEEEAAEAPAEAAGETQDPEPSGSAEPEASAEAEASDIPAQEEAKAEEEEQGLIKLNDPGSLTELEDLLEGDEADIPEGDADESYCFVLAEPGEILKDYKLRVYIYGEEIYYVQELSADMAVSYLSCCTMEDFEKFLDGLSESEKAGLNVPESPAPDKAAAEPSPTPTAAPEKPETSPTQASPAPAESK